MLFQELELDSAPVRNRVCLHKNGMYENGDERVNYHTGPAWQLLAMAHVLIYDSG